MTHRIEVNVETGVTAQVEYTAEEQAVHDAAVAATLAQPAPAPAPLSIQSCLPPLIQEQKPRPEVQEEYSSRYQVRGLCLEASLLFPPLP